MERWYFDEKNHKLNTEGNCIRKYSIKIFQNLYNLHFFAGQEANSFAKS